MANLTRLQKKSVKSIIGVGIVLLILGIIAVAYPASIGKITTIAIGVILLFGGIFRLVFAAFSYSMGSLFMRYLYAILMIVAGVWVIMNPDVGLETLTLIIAIYFIVDGITEVIYSFSLMPIGGGIYLLSSGVIGIILGILIISKWPESGNYFIGIYVGIKLIIDGIMLVATGNVIRKSLATD